MKPSSVQLTQAEAEGLRRRAENQDRKLSVIRSQLHAANEKIEHLRYELRRVESVLAACRHRDDVPDDMRAWIDRTIPQTIARDEWRDEWRGERTPEEQITWLTCLLNDSESEVNYWRSQHEEMVRRKRTTHEKAQEFYRRAIRAEAALAERLIG